MNKLGSLLGNHDAEYSILSVWKRLSHGLYERACLPMAMPEETAALRNELIQHVKETVGPTEDKNKQAK